jgi:glycosyltransferase involved in cell wall biosynthesis
MACGTPIIGSNIGGIPEIIEDGIDAVLVPPRNATAMANAIKTLLENHRLYRTISKNGEEKARRFSPETYTKRIVEVLQYGAVLCDK